MIKVFACPGMESKPELRPTYSLRRWRASIRHIDSYVAD